MELEQFIDLTIDKNVLIETLVHDQTFLTQLVQAIATNEAARLLLLKAMEPPSLSKLNDTVVRQAKSSNRTLRS